ncbi:hypothetical protein QOZ80_6AG0519670 [Eleusine coracana subsp. coracana]|nr:hypothetical protein QOZ80_6AG0519670 [Eleusine coracana subsp. coracana]
MDLVREQKKTLCCDDEFFIETETSFLVLDGADSVTYDEYLHHPWELQLPAGNDGSRTNVTAGVSSSSSSSSQVTFDSHGEEYCYGAMAPGHAAGSATSNFFSFEGGNGMVDAMPSTNSKRPREQEEAVTVPRKPCGGKRPATKRAKETTARPPREPQTTTAKNRRERVNERLKVLQELVPSGRKVDTVTMLDKAITYVKFMQLQLKVDFTYRHVN